MKASDRSGVERSVSETAWGSMPRGCKRDSTVHEPVKSALNCKKPEDYSRSTLLRAKMSDICNNRRKTSIDLGGKFLDF